MEGVVEDTLSPPRDLSLIVKGKRTKRLRPHSPIPFTIAAPSPLNCNPTTTTMINLNNNASPQPSSDEEGGCTATEEDEDMANCLILLSQGNPIKDSPTMNLDHVQYAPPPPTEKFNSKRYIEAPISSNGKAGMYVYQCKTCGRTFPSFQALGGHRASHKKPKNMATTTHEAKKISSSLALSDDEEESFKINNYKSKKPPALSLELSNRGGYSNLSTSDITNKSPLPKIHECSYCGAEFASGQALGGHMRRHRGPVAPTTPSTNTTLSLSPLPISPASINQDSDQDAEGKKRTNALSLDLNLPAPEDHDAHGKGPKVAMASKHGNHQQIHQKQQQQAEPEPALLFSTRRFIECHY